MDFNADRQQYHFSVDYDDVLLKLQGIREYSYHYLESALLDNDSTDLKG